MTFDRASAADIPALRQLWTDCFGDPADYVNLYFDHAFAPERVFVLRLEDGLAAMLISFPVTYLAEDGDERDGAYLYAVCTRADLRGRGLCKELMAKTEQALAAQGCAFTCLKAASPELTAMYARMGYRATFTNREYTIGKRQEARGNRSVKLQTVAPEEYYALRQCRLRGAFVDYAPEVLAHQARLGRLLSVDGGAAVAALERYGEAAICKEYLGDEALLPSLCAALGLEALTVRTPGDTPFAMAKALTDAPVPTGYLAFAFD